MVPVCLFHSGGPRPVFLSVFVLRGLQSAHPPSPMELLRLETSLSGGGSYVRVLLRVSCVPASCVHIWFVSCPCFMSLGVKYVFQLCLSRYVLITLCILVLSFEFDFVWSTRYFPGVSCPCQSCLVLPCRALSCLDVSIKYYYLSLRPRLRVPVPPSCVCTVTDIFLATENTFLSINTLEHVVRIKNRKGTLNCKAESETHVICAQ